MNDPVRIDTVSINGTVLTVGWRNGAVEDIDIAGWLARLGPPEFAILKDPDVLSRPLVANWGTVVAWDEEGDIGIDNIHLRLIADQQKPFGPADIAAWQETLGLSNQGAAAMLDIGVTTLHSYKTGLANIPNMVRIACRAIEKDIVLFEAHYKPTPKRGRPRKAA